MKSQSSLKSQHLPSCLLKNPMRQAKKTVLLVLMLSLPSFIYSQINAQFTLPSDTIYYSDTLNLSPAFITPGHTYTWDFGDGNTLTSANVQHNYTFNCQDQTFQIKLTATNGALADSVTKQIVVVNNTPMPSIADIDIYTPLSNCDNSPSNSNPNFNISLNNTTADTSLINHYLVNWGDNTGIKTYTNDSFPISHQYTQLGLFNFTISAVGDNGCTKTNTYSIANQSNPAVGLSSPGNTQGCAPQTFSFILSQFQDNSPGTYYIWDFGDGSPQITWDYNQPYVNNTITHIFDTTSCTQSSYYFTVSVTAYNSCDQTTATVGNIRIYSAPVAKFTTQVDTSCVGSSIQFTNNTTSGFGYNCNGMASYAWNFGDPNSGNNTSNNYNANHSYQQTGTYPITLIASNGICGSSVDTQWVVINKTPEALASLSQNQACIPATIQTTNSSTGENLKYTWTINPSTGWSFANNTHAHSELPEFQFTTSGTYTIQLRAQNNCGFDDTTFTFVAQDSPLLSLQQISDICGSDLINPLANIQNNGSSITQYNWQFSSSTTPSSTLSTPQNILFNTPGNHNIALEIHNACGIIKDSISFNLYALPNIHTQTNNNTICEGDTASLVASGANTYSWSNPSSLNTANQANVFAFPNQNTQYIVSGTDANSCSNTDTIDIIVNSLPQLTISQSQDTICFGDTVNLQVQGASNYFWLSSQSILQNNGNQILWQPNQSAYIAVEGTDQNSCSNSDSVYIYVEHAPSIQIQTPNPQICIGDQTQLNISGGVQYAWSPQTGLNTSTSANPIASPTQTTTYTIESFSQAGCKSDTSLLVQVNNLPNVSASINLNQICIGESVQLQANGASSFAWNNSLNSNTNTLQTFTDQPTANISYFLEGTDNNGCVGKDTIQLTVHQLPNVQIATSSNQICLGESVSFLGSGATSYIWKNNNQQISSGSSFSDNPVSNQSYTLIGTDMNACVDSQAVSVTVHALPTIASTQSHVQICYGDSSLTSVSGATNYQWKLSNNSVHSGPTNYLKSLISGQYTVIGTSSFGCQDSIHIPITVHSLPNVSASTSNANLCLGQSTQITANGAQSYQWSPAINLNNTNSNLVTSTPTSDITYYVNGIDSNGCSSSDSIKLFVSNQLNIQVAASNTSICNGDTVSLQASGANSYQWTQANGLLSNSGNQVYAKPNLPTQFIVTGTDTNGCVSTQSIQINVHSLPNVSVSSLDNYVCPQDSTTLSSSGASSYLWTDLTNGTQHNAPTWQVSPTINTQYRVVGTDVNGCQSEALISIDAAPTPPLQISLSDDSICIGENIQLLASGANNYIWNDQISTYTGQSLSQAPQQNTWYKVTASNSFGCQAIDSAEVHVLALPSFSLSQNSIDLCYGDSAQVQLTGNANYTASPYNGIQISGNSISVNTLSDQIYTIIATNSFGCQSSKNLQVNSRPLPNPDFQLDSIICINNAYNINNLSSGANSFQWSFGDATNSTSNNPSHTYTQSGFYTLDLIATSPYGCIDSISKATQVIEAPVAQFSTFPNSGCGPLTAQFNNQCQGVYNLYQWDLGNGGTCNTETPSNSIFHAGIHQDTSYFVTLTASNMCGIDTYTDTVTVHPSPKSNFGFSLNTQCSPAIATFANASTGQVTSQQWLFGDNTSCITTVPAPHTYTANQNTAHYQVHLISFNSCGVDTMTKTVSVQPNTVQAFFTPSSTTACAPATINFANFSNVVNNATWDFGDNNVSSTISPNHVYQQAGTYQVRLVVTDNCGIDTALATISVQAPPQLSYQLSSDTVCQGSSFSISNLSTGLANVDWNFGDNNGSTINNPIHSYQNAGSYQIQMIGVSQNLICADTLYIPIEVSPSAKAIITSNDADGCAPFTTNFVNSSTNASYYQWIYGDGSTSTNLQGSHTYQNDGTYYCQLVANNFYNCPDTTQMLVKAYPKPVSSFSLPSQIPCELPAAISISNQSSGAVAYQWDLGNNTTSIQNNPQVNYHSNGQFTIQLIATSAYSCNDTSTQTLQLDPTPEAKFRMTSNQACEFSAIEFFNQSLHATSYKWNFGDGEESIVTSPLHVYENDGEYDIKLIAYNSNLCTDTLVLKDTILIHPVPVADFTWHHLYQDDMSKGMVQFENRSVDANNFYWDFDDGENSSDNHPAHQFLSHGDYYVSLHVDNQYGCARDTTQLVHIDHVKGLFIPNAVMPTHTNPDVALFTPKGIGLQEYEIRIYDQWGNLVWMSNQLIDGQPAESWDGKKDGVILPAGTYVWKAQAIFLDGSVWRGNQISENETMKTEGLLRVIR